MTVPNLSSSENTPRSVPDPNNVVCYNNRGEVYLREGKVRVIQL